MEYRGNYHSVCRWPGANMEPKLCQSPWRMHTIWTNPTAGPGYTITPLTCTVFCGNLFSCGYISSFMDSCVFLWLYSDFKSLKEIFIQIFFNFRVQLKKLWLIRVMCLHRTGHFIYTYIAIFVDSRGFLWFCRSFLWIRLLYSQIVFRFFFTSFNASKVWAQTMGDDVTM